MKKNKICFIVPDITWIGGIERVICVLSNELYIRGYDVRIVSLSKNNNDIQYELNKSIEVVYLNPEVKNKKIGGLSRVFYHINILIRSSYKFKTRDSDEILIFNSMPAALFGWVSTLFKPNFKLVVEHANYFHYTSIFKYIRNFIYKRYDKVIAITHSDFMEFKRGGFNCEYINNPKSFESDEKSSCNTKEVCAVGRLEEQKSFKTLIESFYLAIKDESSLKDWKLKIYGEGSLRDELQYTIDSYGISDRVFLEGYKKNISKCMIRSSLFVLSSKYEGFGLVLLEAMECGLPVISFDCKFGPEEILGQGKYGILVENQNVISMSKELNRLMSDPVLLNSYKDKAIERSQHYSIDDVIEKWILIFTNSCNCRKSYYEKD